MAEEIAAQIHGVKVPVSPFLNETRTDRINNGRYERQEIEGALSLVRQGDKVLELGAGLGIVGAVVSANRKPSKVLSYEANPALIPHIRALYKANRLSRRNLVRNEVLLSAPSSPKTVEFPVHNSFLGSSLAGNKARAREVVEVKTSDFNALVAEFGPDVLIVDIEGGELDLLEHARLEGVRGVVIEFHPKVYGTGGMRRCKAILRDGGFVQRGELSSRLVWVAERDSGGATGPKQAKA